MSKDRLSPGEFDRSIVYISLVAFLIIVLVAVLVF